MGNLFRRAARRMLGEGIPQQEEIEQFGSEGEEVICRLLRANFDDVIRNVIVPHKKFFLEKDFAVIYHGAIFILEIKNWKGEIGMAGDMFYQQKANGTRKEIKSPVGTTNQFIRVMKEFYGITRAVYGVVVFAEPECTLNLPESSEGVALLTANKLVSYIKSTARSDPKGQEPFAPERLVRCTRFYSNDSEFCKGILAEDTIPLFTKDGRAVQVNADEVRFLSVERQPLLLRDKVYVTFSGGESAVLYNRDTILTVACLDGTYRRLSLNRVRRAVF